MSYSLEQRLTFRSYKENNDLDIDKFNSNPRNVTNYKNIEAMRKIKELEIERNREKDYWEIDE